MQDDAKGAVRTIVLVPERDLGHAIAKKLREDPAIEVIGVSTDPDQDAFGIFEANPDVVLADVDAGGMEFLTTVRLPPGKHRVVFFAPRSAAGCGACYEALVHGAQGIVCRPASADDVSFCADLLQSIRDGSPVRPDDCPAVERLASEKHPSTDD